MIENKDLKDYDIWDRYEMTSFAWEYWSLLYRKAVMEDVQDLDENEKNEKIQSYALYHLFQMRRAKDIAFNAYVHYRILKNKEIRLEIKKEILQLIGIMINTTEMIQNERTTKKSIKGLNPLHSYEEMQNRRRENNMLTQELLYEISEEALSYDDISTYRVANSSLKDYLTGQMFAFQLFKPYNINEGSTDTDIYNYEILQFVHSHIKNYQKYSIQIDHEASVLLQLADYKLRKYIENTIAMTIGKLEFKDQLLLNKLINDLISISSVKWFIRHNLSQRIKILNKNYDMKIMVRLVLPLLRKYNYKNNEINIFLDYLNKFGYFEAYILVYECLIKKKDDINFTNFQILHFYKEIGSTYRELQKYQKAIKYYKLADKIETQEENDEFIYFHLINKIKLIESIALSKTKSNLTFNIDKQISKIIKLAEPLKSKSKVGVLYNIANCYRRMQSLPKELMYLERIIDNHPEQAKKQTSQFENVRKGISSTEAMMGIAKTENLHEVITNRIQHINSGADLQTEVEIITEELRLLLNKAQKLISFYSYKEARKYLAKIEDQVNQYVKNTDLQRELLYPLVIIQFNEDESNLVDLIKQYDFQLKYEFGEQYNAILSYLLVKHSLEPKLDISIDEITQGDNQFIMKYCQSLVSILAQKSNKIKILALLKNLSTLIKLTSQYNFYIAYYLSEAGFIKESQEYIEHVLENVSEVQLEYNFRSLYSINYQKMDQHDEAISSFEKLLHDPDIIKNQKWQKEILTKLGELYAYRLNYAKALYFMKKANEIVQSEQLDSLNLLDSFFQSMFGGGTIDNFRKNYQETQLANYISDRIDYFSIMVKETLNLNYLNKEMLEVRKFLLTAEKYFHEFILSYNNNQTIFKSVDPSFIVLSYSKAVETLLHEKVTLPFRQMMRNEYDSYYPKRIYQSSWFRWKARQFVKPVISVSLGIWLDLCNPQNSGDVLIEFIRDFIKDLFGEDIFKIIFRIAELLKDIRNAVAHTNSIEFSEIIELRPLLIVELNKLMEILHSGTS